MIGGISLRCSVLAIRAVVSPETKNIHKFIPLSSCRARPSNYVHRAHEWRHSLYLACAALPQLRGCSP